MSAHHRGHDSSRTFHFESAPNLPGSDRLSKYLFGGIRRATNRFWDFTVEGRENVPSEGPAVITPNHLSFCDSIFVPAALPRRVWAIGKGEYMDSWKTKHLFPAMGMIPVDRSGGDAAQAALDTAAKVLEDGHLFMIYPEGTRSRSEFLHKGRTGAARLAIRCNAPIVPVGHHGTLAVQAPDSVMMKRNLPVTVRFGRPMWAHEFGDPGDPRTLRSFTDAVMYEIAQLSGQKYVDRYANANDKPGELADLDDPATSASPQRPLQRSTVGRPDMTEGVTPHRPSIIGASPDIVPRPTLRPSPNNHHATSSVGGVVEPPRSIAVPPGRRASVG